MSGEGAARVTAALIGRPNAGKSSLFNRVTGSSAHVGNFPGVTVEVLEAEATLPGGGPCVLVDLPGLYSLDPSVDVSADEVIARDFILAQRDRGEQVVVAQIIDASQLSLGLRLTQEAQRVLSGLPMLLVATQVDVLEREGRALDARALEELTGAAVVLTHAFDDKAKEKVLAGVERALRDGAKEAPPWAPDEVAARALPRLSPEQERNAARERTARIDAVLLNRFLALPLFVLIMGATFAAVFLISDPAKSAIEWALGLLTASLRPVVGDGVVGSLLSDGIIGGVGTVLAFLPQIVVLIALLDLLESSGYLSRAAFIVDRLFRAAGLGGKSFMPLLTAHACAVPAISASRVLRDPRERLTAILVIPLMSCSARLPVYSLLVGAFFGGGALGAAAITTGLYLAGIGTGLVASMVLRRTLTKGKTLPLLLEMPTYKMPVWSATARRCWREAVDFVKKAGTVILAASVLLWALLKLPVLPDPGDGSPEIHRSAAAAVGRALEPISRPIGFDWRINVGLIGSFGARELMVGTMGVIFGIEDADKDAAPLEKKIREARDADGKPLYGKATAASLLAFFVLACQCISTLSAVRRETKSTKLMLFLLGYTYGLAYLVSLLVYQVARALGG